MLRTCWLAANLALLALSGCGAFSASADLDIAEGLALHDVAKNQRAINGRAATQTRALRTTLLGQTYSEAERRIQEAPASQAAAVSLQQIKAIRQAESDTHDALANDAVDASNAEGNCELIEEIAQTRLQLADKAKVLRAKADALAGKTTVLVTGAASQPAR